MVPGGGLYLDELFYDGYHSKIESIASNQSKGAAKAEASASAKSNEDYDDEGDGNVCLHYVDVCLMSYRRIYFDR
jgi:hypothetical protein